MAIAVVAKHEPFQVDEGVACSCGKDWPCPTLKPRPAARHLQVVQNTPGWIDARRDFIGSSDLPILTGNTPYRSASVFSLWAYKTRLAEPPAPDPDDQELFDLGHALEDDIAERYTIKTGRPLRRANRMLVSRRITWASANLDRVSAVRGERRIVELKWVPNRRFELDGPEPVPAHVQDQCQWQLLVSGYDQADVAVLNGSKVQHYELLPDRAYQEDLLAIARWFRGLVERGERPPIDGSDATRVALTRLHPEPRLGMMPRSAETDALAAQWRAARALATAAESESKRLANVVRGVLDDHEGVTGEDYRIYWRKTADSTEVDVKALLADPRLPKRLLARHTKPVAGERRLRPYFKDEETGRWV